ncbi:MAG TPA: DUF3570 domain-containing protein [Puia sp.]|nr:DUF3570 domain-containing protein [Puia sp.]
MKKKYICFGLFTTSFLYGVSQVALNPYGIKRISKSTIEFVYSQYIGNGDHSAITGGLGTENLIVYEPEVIINHQIDSLRSYWVDVGVDVITSASMDNIDFVMSSASRISKRGYIIPGYNTKLKKNRNIIIGGNGYFSIESAYLSLGGALSIDYTSKDKSSELSAEFQAFFDDLRWGLFNGERPLRLVYPVELRYKVWDTVYKRNSYNLSLSFTQTINEKMILAFFPGISYQQGLLSTPYHRVYFTDSTERVEKFPDKRWLIPIGIQLNSFILDRYILSLYYRFYYDNFGITAHTMEVDLTTKISSRFSLTPTFRVYTQKGSPYFKPYYELDPKQPFYTSNYALSSFNSYETGIDARLAVLAKQKANIYFDTIWLRYSYYKRTDGLYGHILTLVLDLVSGNNKKH